MTVSASASAASPACGGAPGRLKTGVNPNIVLQVSAIVGLLTGIATGEAAAFLAPIIAGTQWDGNTLCTRGDPGDPALTQDDFTALSDYFNIPAFNLAVDRVNQLWRHVVFPYWCDCDDGTTPPPASISPLPPVSTNPNLPSGPFGPNCWDTTLTLNPNVAAAVDFSQLGPNLGNMPGWSVNPGPPPRRLPTPLPVSVAFTTMMLPEASAAPQYTGTVQFYDSAGTLISGSSIFSTTTPAGTPTTLTGPVPSTAAYLYLQTNFVGTFSASSEAEGRLQLFCTGQSPTTPVTPCCPPDELLGRQLNNLTQLVQFLVANASSPADALVDGAHHGPFSGSGSVLLEAECAAVRVTVQNDLSVWPKNPGTPDYFFSLGFVTSYAEGTPLKGWRLVYSSQTFPLATYADMVGWTLPPGVSITVTEQLGVAAA